MANVMTPGYSGNYVVIGEPLPYVVIPTATVLQTSLTSEELINGEAPCTCRRCGALYKASENVEECLMHPGKLMDYNMARISTWSCCHEPSQSRGCVKVFHAPQEQASEELKRFYMMTSAAESMRTVTPNLMPGGAVLPVAPKRRIVRSDNEPKDGHVIHTVIPTDTLDGISLKYDISKAEIIRANRGLSAASFPAYRTLLIPVGDAEVVLTDMLSPEERRKLEEERLRTRFSRMHRVSAEEASAYLSSHDYDFDKATKDYLDDMAFENTTTSSANSSKNIFSSRSTKFEPLPSATRK